MFGKANCSLLQDFPKCKNLTCNLHGVLLRCISLILLLCVPLIYLPKLRCETQNGIRFRRKDSLDGQAYSVKCVISCALSCIAYGFGVHELNEGEVTTHFVDKVAGFPRTYGSNSIDGIKSTCYWFGLLSFGTVR